MNRRKLKRKYYLVVSNITFASDAIGAASGTGRTAVTSWAADDEVIFYGSLEQILIFALMSFDVASVSIGETFAVFPESGVHNLPSPDDVSLILLDPEEGEGIVIDDDITFLQNLTNTYRMNWTDRHGIIFELVADGTKTYYQGSVLEALAYALQYNDTAVIYSVYKTALVDMSAYRNMGISWIEITGPSGPVQIEKAHVTLANTLLNVPEV